MNFRWRRLQRQCLPARGFGPSTYAQPADRRPWRPAARQPALVEAIRDRIDHLRYADAHDMRGTQVVLDDYVARFYESQQFQPAWQDAGAPRRTGSRDR